MPLLLSMRCSSTEFLVSAAAMLGHARSDILVDDRFSIVSPRLLAIAWTTAVAPFVSNPFHDRSNDCNWGSTMAQEVRYSSQQAMLGSYRLLWREYLQCRVACYALRKEFTSCGPNGVPR